MTRVYVAGRAVAWHSIRLGTESGPEVTGPGLGFLPIFGSKEDAEREYPDSSVYAIEVPDSWVRAARPKAPPPGVA